MIRPRPYQAEALAALDRHICRQDTNPCVVIPTGGGKSMMMAWAIQRWKQQTPHFRVIVLAHRKELVRQNSDELRELWPEGDIGVYAAGLGLRQDDRDITFASIDSVWRKAGHFPPFHVIIVDEAHRIPAAGEGKYRRFIEECRIQNKNLRVIGFTATPFRMGCGDICHRDHILNKICYEANVSDLINDGYLCKLRSKIGDVQPVLDGVKRNSGGDYITNSLASVVATKDLVGKAIRSILEILAAEKRKSVIFFCVDVEHCKRVSEELRRYNIEAPAITAKTPADVRDRVARQFKEGIIHAICNVNVYTEGFNATRIDCIALLRPTLSAALYQQMVGRGLRVHPGKEDCLILDFARCIEEHGPVDTLSGGPTKVVECPSCGDVFSRSRRKCPHCDWEIPKQQLEQIAADEERERRMHEVRHSNRSILSTPETLGVTGVSVHRHKKEGKPDSIRVQYQCGLSTHREWVCLDHTGYPEERARKWWAERLLPNPKTITVDEALQDMFLAHHIKHRTKTITVVQKGKHTEIIAYEINT